MVIDTSALLAIWFRESTGEWAALKMNQNAGDLLMSTVNLAETLILLKDRLPEDADRLERALLGAGIEFVAPDIEQARIASSARLRFRLNLGDCFAYALASVREVPVLSCDRDFRALDIESVLPPSLSTQS